MTTKQGPLDVTFEAPLEKSAAKGGWTCVATTPRDCSLEAPRAQAHTPAGTPERPWPQSAEYFGTRGLVKVRGTVVTIGPHTWRSSIANMGGQFMLGLSIENRAAADVAAGAVLDIDVELDTAERSVDVPADLAAELVRDDAVRATWDRWSYTRRKEAARGLTEAKKPETRTRRLEKVLADLRD